jgi:hypothetical protein
MVRYPSRSLRRVAATAAAAVAGALTTAPAFAAHAASTAVTITQSARVSGVTITSPPDCDEVMHIESTATFVPYAVSPKAKIEWTMAGGLPVEQYYLPPPAHGGATVTRARLHHPIHVSNQVAVIVKITWIASDVQVQANDPYHESTDSKEVTFDRSDWSKSGKLRTDERCEIASLKDAFCNLAHAWKRQAAGNTGVASIRAAETLALCLRLSLLVSDPPDPDYTTLPVPVAPSMPPVVAGGGVSPATAAALNDERARLAEILAEAGAAVSGIERATAARIAADKAWDERQSLAAADHLNALADKLDAFGPTMQALGAALKADGLGNSPLGPMDYATAADAFETLSQAETDWLHSQAGLSDDDLREAPALVADVVSKRKTMTTLAGLYMDPKLATDISTATVALRKSAATLIANPLIDFSNSGAPRPSETRSAAPPTQSATAQASGSLGDAGSRASRMPLWAVGVIVVVLLAILAAVVFLFVRFRHRRAVTPATNAATSTDIPP